MITSNVFRRTFFIRFGSCTGTAFTIDIEKKQYLVTARHVCQEISDNNRVYVFHDGNWICTTIKVVGMGVEGQVDTDVAVLSLPKQLSPSSPMPATSEDLIWGQDVYFLGFPYGLHTSVGMNTGFPLPFIKKAIISASIGAPGTHQVFLLDGHNNPGFSGGPVVFRPQSKTRENFRVMAVVSAFRTQDVEVRFQGKPTGLTNPTNTGIVVCPSIGQVTDIISANPIGPPIVA